MRAHTWVVMTETEILARRVQELRETAGLSQREASGLAGLSSAAFSFLERGEKQDARVSTLKKVAVLFGVPLTYITDGDGSAPSKESVLSAVADARSRAAQNEPADDQPEQGAAE